MKVLSVKDKKVAKRLTDRLLKKGLVVAQAEKEEDLKKDLPRKADVVILLSEGVSKTLD
ncbi:hypothetical protein IAE16_09145 [Hydrogenobacter sp. T-2]|uniref:hypothetical protein n=1 Tax=Pampinifervens diazotrophicum TaxID=1632018 RepID=UPI002B262129|nr:hypothetical protein [Hydrogenobacter sp. T-2]WPM31976.1 hypothetical protein IAE16_09145 [Hydrogenobacter sp. T-2]